MTKGELMTKCKLENREPTFVEWLDAERGRSTDYLPPLNAQVAIDFLKNYLLDEDWHFTASTSTEQLNVEIVDAILRKYSKRYRDETAVRGRGNEK